MLIKAGYKNSRQYKYINAEIKNIGASSRDSRTKLIVSYKTIQPEVSGAVFSTNQKSLAALTQKNPQVNVKHPMIWTPIHNKYKVTQRHISLWNKQSVFFGDLVNNAPV